MDITKICIKCKKDLPIEDFNPLWYDQNKRAGACKECAKAYHRAFEKKPEQRRRKKKYHEIYKETESYKFSMTTQNKKRYTSIKGRYSALIKRCKKIRREMSLTLQQFTDLCDLPCIYCNGLLCDKTIAGCNLDRIDNTKGYTPDNVQPCGSFCNSVRSNNLSVKEMHLVAQVLIKERCTTIS